MKKKEYKFSIFDINKPLLSDDAIITINSNKRIDALKVYLNNNDETFSSIKRSGGKFVRCCVTPIDEQKKYKIGNTMWYEII